MTSIQVTGGSPNVCIVCIERERRAVLQLGCGHMGQQVAVTERPSPRPGVIRFETNRSLTGMGHEHFSSMADAIGPRPAAALARQLLSTGKVDSVYIYGNIVTVDVSKGFTADGLGDVVRNMYQYWKPGVEIPIVRCAGTRAEARGSGRWRHWWRGRRVGVHPVGAAEPARTQRRRTGQGPSRRLSWSLT